MWKSGSERIVKFVIKYQSNQRCLFWWEKMDSDEFTKNYSHARVINI